MISTKFRGSSSDFCFDHFNQTQVNLGSDSWVRLSVRHSVTHVCEDLTDVTLADEDTNSILADNAKRAIQGNEAMEVIHGDEWLFHDLYATAGLLMLAQGFKC